jgi:hypothetical protein
MIEITNSSRYPVSPGGTEFGGARHFAIELGGRTAELSQTTDVATGVKPVAAGRPLPTVWPVIGAQDSAAWQSVAILMATIAIGVIHWDNDGLWFQGDAPRHAANGLFILDLVRALPTNPIAFALSYYARYPVITPGAYPPVFYVLEAIAFGLTAASPYTAKVLVLAFAAIAGIYTMRYARRWIGPTAGWAGLCVVASPGFILYSNAVLLNVPATALGMAALFHFREWLETQRPADRRFAVGFTIAAFLTYYPAGLIVIIGLVWMACARTRPKARFLWLIPLTLLAIALAISVMLPGYFLRNAAPVSRFLDWSHWMSLIRGLRGLTGLPLALLVCLGLLWGFVSRTQRMESVRLFLAVLAASAVNLLTTWADPRYLLVLCPIMILSAFLGLASLARLAGSSRVIASTVAPLVALLIAVHSAATTSVPSAKGFKEVVEFLQTQGPKDSVLYVGHYDGVFAFYVRMLDPWFERRVVLWRKALAPGMAASMTLKDAVNFIEDEAGCQWVALEFDEGRLVTRGQVLLRAAVQAPEFELVRTFPLDTVEARRVDLYRVKAPVAPPKPVELRFPGFSNTVFQGVQPIKSRR